jgi:hypothetical protein
MLKSCSTIRKENRPENGCSPILNKCLLVKQLCGQGVKKIGCNPKVPSRGRSGNGRLDLQKKERKKDTGKTVVGSVYLY